MIKENFKILSLMTSLVKVGLGDGVPIEE